MDLNQFLDRGAKIADLLLGAGFSEQAIRRNRHFSSNWGWDDGTTAVITIWMHDVQDPTGKPKWGQTDPAYREDLIGQRLHRAVDLFEILKRHEGRSVRVILQRFKEDREQWSKGKSEARGLDPEAWFVAREGENFLLQRGSLPGRRDADVSGEPMPPRHPSFSVRETRPDQGKFRQRVGSKTGNRCALTGAPNEVCDAAHFPWCDWRTDNDACHGVLLRRDLHAALDCNLISVDAEGKVVVSEYLASSNVEYMALHGRIVPV